MSQNLPSDSVARKSVPLCSGVLDYFPAALAAVAEVSKKGNDKHNPGEPLHHARGKSMDHADCIARHLLDRGTLDAEGVRHTASMAWRALALLQEELEQAGAPLARGAKLPESLRAQPGGASVSPITEEIAARQITQTAVLGAEYMLHPSILPFQWDTDYPNKSLYKVLQQMQQALSVAADICDAVPARDTTGLGELVNGQPGQWVGTSGYALIRDALSEVREIIRKADQTA